MICCRPLNRLRAINAEKNKGGAAHLSSADCSSARESDCGARVNARLSRFLPLKFDCVRLGPLTPQQEKKETDLAYATWLLCLVGMCGMQRLYLGHTGLGLAMLFTFGFCGIGQILDIFLIPNEVKEANKQEDDQALAKRTANIESGVVNKSALSPSTNLDKASVDELDNLMREAENALQQTQSKP